MKHPFFATTVLSLALSGPALHAQAPDFEAQKGTTAQPGQRGGPGGAQPGARPGGRGNRGGRGNLSPEQRAQMQEQMAQMRATGLPRC